VAQRNRNTSQFSRHNPAAGQQGNLEDAYLLYQQSLDIAQKLGDLSGIASALHELGRLAQDQRDLDEARSLYQQSLDINRKLGNQISIASALDQLGQLAEVEGDRVEATRLFREVLTIFERLKSPNAEIARENLARVEGRNEG
jgi:tetratricopeptide (TPR) repeat protein